VHGRPYVTLKWAQTADGKVAGAGGKRLQISNARSMRLVHELRARCDAIMVGINTVLADNPRLIPRGVERIRGLLRVVLDRRFRIPLDSEIVEGADLLQMKHETDTVVIGEEPFLDPQRRSALMAHRVMIGTQKSSDLPEVLAMLGRFRPRTRNSPHLTHLLVEPGPTLARSFLETDLVDRVWIFSSSAALNEASAPSAMAIPEHYVRTGALNVQGDLLTEYLDPRGSVFFACQPSADFVLAEEEIRADKASTSSAQGNVCAND
jgi:diaminohydroxyphosphoribosylaminopyrimidine deaminase/5-amino-6-(5-phosphoribosylamino)uracil reductase